MAKTKLVSMNMLGNLHDVANYVNRFGLSDYFVQADTLGGTSLILFRLPADWPVDNHGPLPAAGTALHPTAMPLAVTFTPEEYGMLARIADAGMWELASKPHTPEDEQIWERVCAKLCMPGYEKKDQE